MTDLQTRFQSLDALHAPDMWPEIEARAQAKERHVTGPRSWLLIGVAVMLALVVGAAVLIGSGVVKVSTTVPNTTPATTPITAPSTVPTTQPRTGHPAAWVVSGSMLEARIGHTATLLSDGRVLVAGGFNASKRLASAELYDPRSGSWTATGSMLEARSNHTATLLADGRVLVASGALDPPGGSIFAQHAELYDPDTGTWSATGGLSFLPFYLPPTATLLADGRVLLEGSVYDPDTGTWHATQGMVEPGHEYAATRLPDGTVVVAGGTYGGRALASAQLFNPATRTWTATGSLREPRINGVATLLLDGTVLLAGGLGTAGDPLASAERIDPASGPPLASAELFDPASGSWTATGNMLIARGRRDTFTLLQDGTVLAAGGVSPRGVTAAAELYDPVSRTWTATASMDAGRYDHTATLLADGTVLVVGGSMNTGPEAPVASAEVYYHASGN